MFRFYQQDGERWRWVDEGDTPNYTNWADGQPMTDDWAHFSYIDTGNDWQWHQSISDNDVIKSSLYKICKKGDLIM